MRPSRKRNLHEGGCGAPQRDVFFFAQMLNRFRAKRALAEGETPTLQSTKECPRTLL